MALLNGSFLLLSGLSLLSGCFGSGTCPGAVEWLLLLFWGLLGLVIVTAAISIISGILLIRHAEWHRSLGSLDAGFAAASILGLIVAYPVFFWAIIVFLGGWSLFLILIGGLVAVFWRPKHRTPPPTFPYTQQS